MAAYTRVIDEYDFDVDEAVKSMLDDGAIFIGGSKSPFFEPGSGDPATLWVNCNDLWEWATADAEPLDYADIESFYVATCDPRRFSNTRWKCLRYQRPPMPEIIYDMKKAGVWDEEMEGLVDS